MHPLHGGKEHETESKQWVEMMTLILCTTDDDETEKYHDNICTVHKEYKTPMICASCNIVWTIQTNKEFSSSWIIVLYSTLKLF